MKLETLFALSAAITLCQAYDDSEKICWDIRLNNPDAFCFEPIAYPLSTETFYNAELLDEAAKARYMTLLDKWEKGGKGSPSNHCLAIARDFYCFNEFKRCEGKGNEEMALCEHTCATWLERCPFEN